MCARGMLLVFESVVTIAIGMVEIASVEVPDAVASTNAQGAPAAPAVVSELQAF